MNYTLAENFHFRSEVLNIIHNYASRVKEF